MAETNYSVAPRAQPGAAVTAVGRAEVGRAPAVGVARTAAAASGSAVAAGPSSHHVGRLGTSVLTTGPLGAAATAAQSSQASSSGRSPLLPATLSRVATRPSHSPASSRADAGSSGSPIAAPAVTGSNSSSRFQGLAARGSSTVNALSSPTALRGPAPTFGAQRTGALTGPTPSAASAAAASRLRAGSLASHQDPSEGTSATSVRAGTAHGAVPTSRVGGGYGALAPRSTAGTRMAGTSTNRSSSGSQGTGGMASPSSSTAAPSAPRPASGSISTPAPDLTSLAAGNLMFPIAAGQPPEVLAGDPPNSRQASARRPSVPSGPPPRPSGPAPSSSSPSAASAAAAVGTRFLNPYSASYATQTGQVHRPDRPGTGSDASVNSNDSDERSGAGARFGHSSRDGALAAAELGGVGLTGLMSRMRGVGAGGASGASGQLASSSHGSGAARGQSGAPLHQQGTGAARGQGPSTQHQQQRMPLRGAAGGTSGGDAGSDVEDDSADDSPVMPSGRAGGTSGGSASPGDRVTATHRLIGGAGRDGTMGGGSGGGAHARASIVATLNRLSAAAADAAAALGPGIGPSSAAAAAAAAAASAAQVRRRQGHGGLGAGSTTGGSTTSGRSSALTGHAEFGRAGSGSGASRSMAAADLDLDLDFRLNHTARGRDASRPWLTDRDRDRVVDGDEDTVGPSQARARLREGLAARDAERSMLLQALMGGPTDFLDMAEEMQMAMESGQPSTSPPATTAGAGSETASGRHASIGLGQRPSLQQRSGAQPSHPSHVALDQNGPLPGLGLSPLAMLAGLAGGGFGMGRGAGPRLMLAPPRDHPLGLVLRQQLGITPDQDEGMPLILRFEGGPGGGGGGSAGLGAGSAGVAMGPNGALMDMSYESLLQLEDVKVPAPKYIIDALPRTQAKKGTSSDEGPCAICQVEYEQGDTLATLPCKHCFHSGCVGQWLSAYSKKCPVCKAEVC